MSTQCVFCRIVAGELPASEIYQDDEFISFMDIYPWRAGHLLVLPKRHGQHVREMTTGAPARLFGLGARIAAALHASSLPCDDLHFVLNDGPAAAQTVPHTHLHLVPRCRGDKLRVLGRLLVQPLVPLLQPTDRAVLDCQAAEIRSHLT